ncbi:hypothetical protein T440DRAFT_464437 [Plenodomus tracheiphilus IPT5]|uniref:2EXR domain-containing protein n=1 Tax=Plenodomus tracheiphilus IPT5 TaxID=1408161 RepID=A0A6A7BI67_9PLEO|nr:hypothetical protein T440DRAFT_464437 [Plenodomus tracheiphilus IPT5]
MSLPSAIQVDSLPCTILQIRHDNMPPADKMKHVASTTSALDEDNNPQAYIETEDDFSFSQQPFFPILQCFNSVYRSPSVINDSDAEEDDLPPESAPCSPMSSQTTLRRPRSPPPTTDNRLHKRVKLEQNPQTNTTTIDPKCILCLPEQIRIMIYTLAAPHPQPRILELHTYNDTNYTTNLQYHPPLPSLFSVCREARRAAMAKAGGEILHFTGDMARFHDTAVRGTAFYFNFSTDTLFLGKRFTAARNTTETARLRDLLRMLRRPVLARVERLLLTYSGRDRYADFGRLVGSFEKLKMLCVGVQIGFGARWRWSPWR